MPDISDNSDEAKKKKRAQHQEQCNRPAGPKPQTFDLAMLSLGNFSENSGTNCKFVP